MKKFISAGLVCLLTVSVFTSCGKPKFTGIWKICTQNGTALDDTVEFGNDGQILIDGKDGEYEVVNGETIEINADNLNFKIIDKDKKLVYIQDISEKAQKKSLDSTAENLMKAMTAVLVEMDEENIFFNEPAIICSDESSNLNAVPKNAESDFDIIERVRCYFGDIDEYEYMFFIKHADCYGVVCKDKYDDSNIVGFCNNRFLVNSDGEITPDFDSDMDFNDICEYYKNQVLTEN